MAIRIFLTKLRLYQWKQVTGVFEGTPNAWAPEHKTTVQ
jgi:hypothetical protein